jgi:hypothetical protein
MSNFQFTATHIAPSENKIADAFVSWTVSEIQRGTKMCRGETSSETTGVLGAFALTVDGE